MAIAVASPSPETAVQAEQSIEMLDLTSIKPAPDNPRQDVGDVAELAQSMQELGMLQPLIVTPRDGMFMVVCGHRRYAAAQHASLGRAPAIIRELTETQRIKAMLIENCQRENLKPLEEGRAYQGLVDLEMSQREISRDVGKSQGHISKRLALLELPAKARAALDSDGITLDDARELLRLKDMPKRLEAAMKEGQRSGNVKRYVDAEIYAHAIAEKVGLAKQRLQQQGVKIVEYVQESNWSGRRLPGGVKPIRKGAPDWSSDVDADPKKHAALLCHAAAVNPRDGEVVYLCTKPATHAKGSGKAAPSVDEKAARAKEREKERSQALRAREKNITLGATLTKKLAAPKIDARNMRLLVELLFNSGGMDRFGTRLALRGFRYTDEASQTIVTRKDGTVSKITHANDAGAARAILEDRLEAAKTAEEIMGVVLQALVAARYAEKNAVPRTQRSGHLSFLDSAYYAADKGHKATIEKIAAPVVGKTREEQ